MQKLRGNYITFDVDLINVSVYVMKIALNCRESLESFTTTNFMVHRTHYREFIQKTSNLLRFYECNFIT
jgi:hypothetical protein